MEASFSVELESVHGACPTDRRFDSIIRSVRRASTGAATEFGWDQALGVISARFHIETGDEAVAVRIATRAFASALRVAGVRGEAIERIDVAAYAA